MTFGDIRYLGLLFFIPVYVFFAVRSYRKASDWLFAFAQEKKKLVPFVFHTVFVCLSLAGLALALANPAVQYLKTYFNRAGIEVVLGIDVSKSMLAEDVVLPLEGRKLFPVANRLNEARFFALEFLSELHGERLGAFVFAGNGVEVIPFTKDYGYGRYVLKHINPMDVTLPGSDLGMAIRTGIAMFEASPFPGIKRMVLISDGEDITPDKSTLYESAQAAARKGVRIYTVGIGVGRAVLIPIRDESGLTIQNYYLDQDGSYLKTRLEPETLKTIATLTKGEYFRVLDERTAEQVLSKVLEGAKGFTQTRSQELTWLDLSPFFLLAALGFFVAGVFFGE